MKFIILSLLTVSVIGIAKTETWEIEGSHATARFKIRHMMVSNVTGEIGGMEGNLELDGADLSKLSLTGSLKVAALTTNNKDRDDHLKNPDFFDVKKFPKILFKSKKASATGKNSFDLTGDLTMHGVTKEVVLSGEITDEAKNFKGKPIRGFTASTKLNRKDFGLTYNKILESGGVALGEEVDVTIEFEMLKAEPNKKG